MKRFLAVPTWIIVRSIVNLLPKDHPFYRRNFSLREWANGTTDLTLWYGLALYLSTITWLIVLAVTIFFPSGK
jgi:hypothetical protein